MQKESAASEPHECSPRAEEGDFVPIGTVQVIVLLVWHFVRQRR